MANQTKTLSKEFVNSFIQSTIYKMRGMNMDIDFWNYRRMNYTNNEDYKIITPIKKIDGIDGCEVYIEISRGGDVYICVSKYYAGDTLNFSRLIYEYTGEDRIDDDDYCMVETDHYIALITEIDWEDAFSYILNNIKFNRTLGRFVDYTATDEDLELFGYEIDDCCVCYEKTTSICENKHYTCKDCRDKIRKSVAPINYRCPICRGKFK